MASVRTGHIFVAVAFDCYFIRKISAIVTSLLKVTGLDKPTFLSWYFCIQKLIFNKVALITVATYIYIRLFKIKHNQKKLVLSAF